MVINVVSSRGSVARNRSFPKLKRASSSSSKERLSSNGDMKNKVRGYLGRTWSDPLLKKKKDLVTTSSGSMLGTERELQDRPFIPLRSSQNDEIPLHNSDDLDMRASTPVLAATNSTSNNSATSNGSDSTDGAQEWLVQNLCIRPANIFQAESRSDTEDCNVMSSSWCGNFSKDKELRDTNDHKPFEGGTEVGSSGSVSTIGQMFGDLISLPSVGTQENDDDRFSMGDLSALSEKGLEISPSDNDLLLVESESECIRINEQKDIEEGIHKIDEVIDIQNKRHQGSLRKKESFHCRNDEKGSVASRLKTLLKELRLTINKYGRNDVRCANVTAALADVYDEDEEYDQALKAYREAAMVYSTKLGDHHVTTLDAKIRVGKSLEKTGEYNEAIQTLYNVMLMRQALLGERHSSVADVLVMIARVLDKKRQSPKAIKEMKRALKIYRETLGDAHPLVAKTVDEIAALYMKSSDHQKACAILEEVVKLRAATLGLNHPDVAYSLMEMASAQEATGDYSKALKSLKKSHMIYTETENERSPNTLLALERIAMNYKATHEKEKAVATYVGVLRGRKQAFGENHPKVAESYLQLGILLKDTDENERAMKCMNHALALYVGEGKDLHDVGLIARTMHEIGLLHTATKQPVEARKVFKQEISIRQKMGPKELPNIAKTLNQIGVLEYEAQNHSRALNYFMEALAIFEKTEGLGIDFGEVLLNTGFALKASGHWQRAGEAFLESHSIFKTHGLKDDHPLLMKAAAEVSQKRNPCDGQDSDCSTVPCKSPTLAAC